MTTQHIAPDELLLDYASGALSEPMNLVVATHLALAPQARRRVCEFEEIGGAMLDEIEPEPIEGGAVDALLERLDEVDTDAPEAPASRMKPVGDTALPEPLRSYVGTCLDELNWVSRGPLDEVALLSDQPGVKTRLMRIRPGAAMPSHTHEGFEATLVLQGGFTDSTGHYRRGDIAVADDDVDHRPVADDDEVCICLAVTEGRLKLTGPVGRWLNPFVRI